METVKIEDDEHITMTESELFVLKFHNQEDLQVTELLCGEQYKYKNIPILII